MPPEVVVPFVAGIIGTRPDFGECVTMAVVDRQNKIVAGIVFHNWEPASGVIEISAAATSPRWATKNILRAALDYCYRVAECQLVVTRYAETNTPAHRLWRGLGSETYVIPRLRGRDEAETIATLTAEAWAQSKFMRPTDGKT
jgi:RimJ/RimL family protein N-acetyltransferase